MRANGWILIFAISVLFFSARCSVQKESADFQEYKFKPAGESLMNYKVPRWYEDAKLGIYFYWVPFSAAAYKAEWYLHWMYSQPRIKNRRNGSIPNVIKL